MHTPLGTLCGLTQLSTGVVMAWHLLLQDAPEWHGGDTEATENEGEGELFEVGQECLDRVALALGGNTIFPLAGQYLPGLMQGQDWRERHAALICLAQIAEGCTKTMLKHLEELTKLCIMVSSTVGSCQPCLSVPMVEGLLILIARMACSKLPKACATCAALKQCHCSLQLLAACICWCLDYAAGQLPSRLRGVSPCAAGAAGSPCQGALGGVPGARADVY